MCVPLAVVAFAVVQELLKLEHVKRDARIDSIIRESGRLVRQPLESQQAAYRDQPDALAQGLLFKGRQPACRR